MGSPQFMVSSFCQGKIEGIVPLPGCLVCRRVIYQVCGGVLPDELVQILADGFSTKLRPHQRPVHQGG